MNDERIHIDTHSILGWAGRGAWLKILLGFSSLVGDSCSIAFTSCPNTLRQAYRPLLLFIILFEGIHIRNRMFISVLNKREVSLQTFVLKLVTTALPDTWMIWTLLQEPWFQVHGVNIIIMTSSHSADRAQIIFRWKPREFDTNSIFILIRLEQCRGRNMEHYTANIWANVMLTTE